MTVREPYGADKLRSKVRSAKPTARIAKDPKVRFTVAIKSSVLKSIKEEAKHCGMSVRDLIRKHLDVLAWAHKMRLEAGRPHPYRNEK